MPETPRPWIARFHETSRCCDASRRLADAVSLHAIAGSAGRYLIIRLIDGGSDGAVYDDRAAAEAHKTHPAQIGLMIPPGGMNGREAEEVLHYHRELYDRLGGRVLQLPHLMPLTRAGQRRQIRAFAKR